MRGATLHDLTSIDAAMAVLDRFMTAFNSGNSSRVAETFNFPHVRFHSGKVTIYPTAADFGLQSFQASADAKEWSRSVWIDRHVIHAGADKVHLDTQFSRRRADGSTIATYRSIYIVTRIDGRWGIQGRSSFAP
ncbi:MAG: hypothetical protein SFW09_20200 [Hyphomicrobiaceae bacterium]|nr:hypothetical protein [Hyphomicrobiaceae bacterium]